MSPVSLSIGARLKSARSAKGLSLEAVARATKIQRKILEALEEDRVEEILDPAYSKIFVKKYATYLGLDGAFLLEEYRVLHASVMDQPEAPEPSTVKTPREPSKLPRVLVPASLGLLGLIGLSFFGYLAMDLYGSLKKNRRTPQVVSLRRATSSSSLPVVERVPAAAPKLIVPRSTPLKLTIRTKADVWMQVKSDGAVIFQNVLPKGARENWTAKEELELWTGNAGEIELTLNGRSLGNPGSGVKKGIKITREGLKLPQ